MPDRLRRLRRQIKRLLPYWSRVLPRCVVQLVFDLLRLREL
jgi:hypothetical protein